MTKILVVDDEAEIRSLIGAVLQSKGFGVVTAEDGAAALQQVQRERPAVILLDLSMPRMSGMDALPEIKRLDPEVPVIICTAHADLATAVRAMKLGAYDYLTKPFDVELLALTVERAVERNQLRSRIDELKRQGPGGSLVERMGGSPAIAHVIQQVGQVAESNFTVLVQGETGTGKELVARAIHQQSPRRLAPFVAVDCGAIPETLVESELFGHERGAFTGAQSRREGHFQLAKGGTLFLDEIGNVPVATQAKLLRALEQREVQPLGSARAVPVDARIIAATNSELQEGVKSGRFRADLYYRLGEFTITLPPAQPARGHRPSRSAISRRGEHGAGPAGAPDRRRSHAGAAPPRLARQRAGAQERDPQGGPRRDRRGHGGARPPAYRGSRHRGAGRRRSPRQRSLAA